MKSGNQSDDGGFTRTGRADQRRHRAGWGAKGNVVQNGLLLLVGEGHVLEGHFAADFRERESSAGVLVLRSFVEDLTRSFQPGNRFCDLRSDANYLKQRSGKVAEEHGVSEETAKCE